jgi:superfamily I DNA and/or RNA helicase
VADALVAHERRERVELARRRRNLWPPEEVAWAAIDAGLVGREADGQDLLAAAWRERLRAAPASDRAAADAYAQAVKAGSARSARRQMPATLACFPVWAVTSLSAAANFPLEAGLFDLVVIDEASQSDLASAIPLLFRAKRALVVGDPNQLTHICALSDERDRRLAEGHGLDDEARAAFSYKSTSLFAAAERAAGRLSVFLRQHFRSHPDIIGFANREVYGGKLVVRTPVSRLLPGRAFEWAHVEGPWERGPSDRSVRKPDEARAALTELDGILAEFGEEEVSVGIVSPFRAQVNLLRDRLAPELAGRVTIDTAHGFQGDERDVMILSPAVAPDLPEFTLRFAGDRNLVNVAVTRARSRLVVVGDHRACLGLPNLLGALARYAVDLGAVRDARR